MTRIVFDIETDGLLPRAKTIHCIATHNIDTKESLSFDNTSIPEGLSYLESAEILIGHNISGFDLHIIETLSEGFTFTHRMHDTLLMSRMAFLTNIREHDYKRLKTGFPKSLVGLHSLKAWGYRLNFLKGHFHETADWSRFTPEMLDYCVQDTTLTTLLYHHMMNELKETPTDAFETEAAANYLLTKANVTGIGFDEVGGAKLYAQLMDTREKAEQKLKEIIKPKSISLGYFTPKRDNSRLGYKEGCTVEKIKILEFNPRSTQQIADRLISEYGWYPTEFTEAGNPKVTEEFLQSLAYKPIPALIEFKKANKLIAQLAEGRVPWLKLVTKGKIHGQTQCTGSRTGRMAHNRPNMAQIPSSQNVRKLFHAPTPGWSLLDSDLSGIELRILAHYLAKFGNDTFIEAVTQGDPHKLFMQWTGIKNRDTQKQFSYALIYGAGVQKLGGIIYRDIEESTPIRNLTEKDISKLGQNAMTKIFNNLKGFKPLHSMVTKLATTKEELPLIDGRIVKTNGTHSALNTLIQGSASVVLKVWMKNLYKRLHGTELETSTNFLAAIHDELLFEVEDEDSSKALSHALTQAINETETELKIRCPLQTNTLTGKDWSEVH